MNRRRQAGIAAAVVVAIVAGLSLQTRRGAESPSAEAPVAATPANTATAVPEASAIEAAPASANAAARPSAPAPLPPHDSPLAQIIDGLEARAAAGDLRAACRLAAEADFCLRNPPDDRTLEIVETLAAERAATRAGDVAAIADLEDDRQRAARLCADVPAARLADAAWRRSLQVAQAGDAWFAVRFASGGQLDRRDFLENPAPWQAYRQHAVPLLLRAAAQGEPRALWLLWRVHAGEQPLPGMPNAIARDARLARVYAVALREIAAGAMRASVEAWLTEAQASADAAAWAEAEREGRALAQGQYAAASPFDPRGGTIGALEPERCDGLSVP